MPNSFERGDALVLRTGWEEYVGEETYFDPPYFSEALAAWIAEQGLGWVGIDAPTPEIPDAIRATDSDYPIHSPLFEHDVLVAENLTNLESLANERVRIVALPLPYSGLDAALARIVARPQ